MTNPVKQMAPILAVDSRLSGIMQKIRKSRAGTGIAFDVQTVAIMGYRNILLTDDPDRLPKLTPPRSQFQNGERTMRQEKGMSDAEKQIESIQSACLREKSTECVCPKCGTHHRVKLLWTGRGKPRKFCPICKHYATAIHDAEPFVVSSVAGAWSSSSA